MTKPTVSIERNAEGKLVKLNSYVVTLCEIDGDDVAAVRMDYFQNKEEVHKVVKEKFKGWKVKTINKLYDEDFVEE